MIAIVDYGMGNTGSVKNALLFLGAEAVISRNPDDLHRATHLILPGVGAFGDGMKKLADFGLVRILEEEVLVKKKPILGICLGMQLFADIGEEGGIHKGLGWISGRTRRFQIDEKKFRLPHIGWNDVEIRAGSALFEGVAPTVFYFVHGYVIEPSDSSAVVAACDYGEVFPAAIEKGNIFGAQFHPEKSQKAGLAVLKNFITV